MFVLKNSALEGFQRFPFFLNHIEFLVDMRNINLVENSEKMKGASEYQLLPIKLRPRLKEISTKLRSKNGDFVFYLYPKYFKKIKDNQPKAGVRGMSPHHENATARTLCCSNA